MKSVFKKFLIFSLLVLAITGSFQFAFEILCWQGAQSQKVSWILSALEKSHFNNFDPRAFQSNHFIDLLKGSAREEILEFLKVDVNRASLEELIGLPRIGPTIAQRIIQMRHLGPFSGLEDLGRVKGLGPKSLEILKDWVRFDSVENS